MADNGRTVAWLNRTSLSQIGGQGSRGPALLKAVEAAGINQIREAEIKGLRPGSLYRVTGKTLRGNLILHFNNKGRVDLLDGGRGTVLVSDVSQIEIKH